jgi:hypothetical protein
MKQVDHGQCRVNRSVQRAFRQQEEFQNALAVISDNQLTNPDRNEILAEISAHPLTYPILSSLSARGARNAISSYLSNRGSTTLIRYTEFQKALLAVQKHNSQYITRTHLFDEINAHPSQYPALSSLSPRYQRNIITNFMNDIFEAWSPTKHNTKVRVWIVQPSEGEHDL